MNSQAYLTLKALAAIAAKHVVTLADHDARLLALVLALAQFIIIIPAGVVHRLVGAATRVHHAAAPAQLRRLHEFFNDTLCRFVQLYTRREQTKSF